jgi:hypothetical protein
MAQPGDDRFGVLTYVHQMLGQLHRMAAYEECAMLAYLIEMAYLESGDVIRAEWPSAIEEFDRNGSS